MSIEASPRISFSNDLCPSSPSIEHTISSEFDFSTSYQVSSSLDDDDYSTPADLLFSQGKLLPLNNSSPIPKQEDQTILKQQILLSRKVLPDSTDKNDQTFWRDSRVSIIGGNNTEGPTVFPFQRSKSTGYYSHKSYKSKSKSSNSANGKAYYYSAAAADRRLPCKNGVRIDPVINVPATFIPRGGSAGSSTTSSGSCTAASAGGSFFAYLLCNCRDKNMEMDDNEGV